MHATICDMITDLVQNAFEAQASEVCLSFKQTPKRWEFAIEDNGTGMSADVLKKATDPFYTDGKKHKNRTVGLGLPFLFQTVDVANGRVHIESKENEGTRIEFAMDCSHIDLPELGDFSTTVVHLMTYNSSINVIIKRQKNENEYEINSLELREVLGDLNDLNSLTLLKEFINAQEESLENS